MGKEYEHIVKTETIVRTILRDGQIIQSFPPEIRILIDELKEINKGKIIVQHLISDNEVKYGILTGKDLQALNDINFGSSVKVSCGSFTIDAKRHSTINRRIDGISRLYRNCEIVGGNRLEIIIDSQNSSIEMKVLD